MSLPQKINKWLRKFLKFLALSFAGLIVLLILIIILTQADPVQNFIIQKATHYISNRTNTTVRYVHITIKVPKTVVIKNIFLADNLADTLLSAGKIPVN